VVVVVDVCLEQSMDDGQVGSESIEEAGLNMQLLMMVMLGIQASSWHRGLPSSVWASVGSAVF